MNISELKFDFSSKFGHPPEAVYFAPGRVNLIGEHIDYNGGHVLPAALGAGTYFGIARNNTNFLNIYSSLFVDHQSFELTELSTATPTGRWTDYIAGMLLQLMAHSGDFGGADVFVSSDLPQGSGLSSSASFSVGFGFAMTDLLGLGMDRVSLALASMSVENDFVGVSCGIMDQFAVAMGKENHCILLDCGTLDYEWLPLNLKNHEIVIANSSVPRKLSESNYNLRRSECEVALAILQKQFDVKNLCSLSLEQVESCDELRNLDIPFRRARHASSENDRVLESTKCLRAGQLAEFGALMNSSHASLRDDFEVSCTELNVLVDTAQSIPGVVGSRMTGAGFGGCTVSIVETGVIEEFIAVLSRSYSIKTAYQAKILRAKPGDGVKRVA